MINSAMRHYSARKPAIILLLGLLLLQACSSSTDGAGIAATVNGRAILSQQVERGHDLITAGETPADPSVASLRQQYGIVLTGLIAQELIRQELEQRRLTVDAAALQKAEAAIRADYPDGAFDRLLMEEAISIQSWRGRLQARLEGELFNQQVIGPMVKVEQGEAEEYVRRRPEDFVRPSQATFLFVRSQNRDAMNRAVESYQRAGLNQPLAALTSIDVREVTLKEERLPETWRRAVKDLKIGEASAIMTDNGMFARLLLISRHPSMPLPANEALELARRRLSENRRNEAYSRWLGAAIMRADIRVNPALLHPNAPEAATATSPNTDQDTGPSAPSPEISPEVLMRNEEASPLAPGTTIAPPASDTRESGGNVSGAGAP